MRQKIIDKIRENFKFMNQYTLAFHNEAYNTELYARQFQEK